MAAHAGMSFVYKSSYDKANRTSADTARGVGIDAGLDILARVKTALDLPVLTDVHSVDQCAAVAEVVDIIQIPAFLCRQTDLLIVAAQTGTVVNIKKGQFLAPWDMQHVAAKVSGAGNNRILLTERGTSFGIIRWCQICAACQLWRRSAFRLFLMPRIRFSNRVGVVAVRVASVNLFRFWHGLRLRSVLMDCLWKVTKIRTMRHQTGQIWCRLIKCQKFYKN